VLGDDDREHGVVGAAQVAQPPMLGEASHEDEGPQRGALRDELMQVGQRGLTR
jgi:hypothetical protein